MCKYALVLFDAVTEDTTIETFEAQNDKEALDKAYYKVINEGYEDTNEGYFVAKIIFDSEEVPE